MKAAVAELDVTVGAIEPSLYVATATDLVRAERAAKSYGAALREAEAAQGLRDAVASQAYRLDRIATTESVTAFNDAKSVETERMAASVGVALMKTWDASLDSRTCDVCSALDGTSVRVGASFPGGQEPGSAHVNCRCVETISAIH